MIKNKKLRSLRRFVLVMFHLMPAFAYAIISFGLLADQKANGGTASLWVWLIISFVLACYYLALVLIDLIILTKKSK